MKVGIVGCGHVGGAMKELFRDACVYDKYKNIGSMEEINSCDAAFVCVPTPMREDGACDTSIVDEVLSWLNTDLIIIRSTVPVGYTRFHQEYHNSKLVFQPEYYGETIEHPFANLQARKWLTLGGREDGLEKAVALYQSVYNADIQVYLTDSDVAELAKYMENAYFATKVTFCNEFYDIAKKLGISYMKVREAWTLDPRIERDHTFVYEDARGFAGSCLPKDLSSIVHQAQENDVDVTLLENVMVKNKVYRSELK